MNRPNCKSLFICS